MKRDMYPVLEVSFCPFEGELYFLYIIQNWFNYYISNKALKSLFYFGSPYKSQRYNYKMIPGAKHPLQCLEGLHPVFLGGYKSTGLIWDRVHQIQGMEPVLENLRTGIVPPVTPNKICKKSDGLVQKPKAERRKQLF